MLAKRRKAQAAMEFLMTYGWAILVVLVAIGALAYFGVLRPERFLPEKCLLASGSGLFCDDYSAADNTVTLRLKNILTNTVTVTYIDFNATGETCTENTYSTGNTINADATTDFTYTCTSIDSGDKIKADVTIIFTPTGGLEKTSTGQLITTAR